MNRTCQICQGGKEGSTAEPTAEAIAHHLEHLARTSIDAINQRDFDIKSPAWAHKSSVLVAEQAHPVYKSPKHVKLAEYLELLQASVKEHPEHHMAILDLNTSVDSTLDKAEVFENLEVTGAPPGVITRMVVVLEFRLRLAPRVFEDPWRCVGVRGMIGT